MFLPNNIQTYSHATIDSKSLTEVTNDALVVFNVLESDVIDHFSLKLDVGRLGHRGIFNPIAGDVTIGEEVRVKLQFMETDDFR